MSMFENFEKDSLYNDLSEFLENHNTSELLEIIALVLQNKGA